MTTATPAHYPDDVSDGAVVPPPCLSLCMTGRDDDYMPDFRYRLVTTVDFLARQLARLGALDQVEILVADWASRTPMHETLAFSVEGARLCRFLYLAPDQLRGLGKDPERFQQTVAVNAAVRRARGGFVMQIGADTLLPLHALDYLLRLCRGEASAPFDLQRALCLVPRVQVPWQWVKRQPSVDEWERYLLLNACYLPVDSPADLNAGGCAGALLMARSLWHEVRGLNETLSGWGWDDCDLASRITQDHPWLALSGLGIVAAHMGHEPAAGRRSATAATSPSAWGRTFRYTLTKAPSDPGWGLAGADLSALPARPTPPSTERLDPPAAALPGPAETAAVIAGCTDRSLHHLVAASVGRLANKRLANAGCVDEWFAWLLIGWWASRGYPRRYLDVGIRQPAAAAIVAAACPTVEILGIDTWDGDVDYAQTGSAIAVGLQAVGHLGRIHFLNGPAAAERLASLPGDPGDIDLAYVREAACGTSFAPAVRQAAAGLSPGGAVAFRAVSPAAADQAWRALAAAALPFAAAYTSPDGRTGLAITARTASGARAGTLSPEVLHGVRPVHWRDVSPALLWQAYRSARPPYAPVCFLRRALRCLLVTGFTRPR